jgi:hypothetical protein
MKKKDFIRILNEEIRDFDFLGNEEYQKEQEPFDLLKNEDFQKQFICDSLLHREKIKFDVSDNIISGDHDEDIEDAREISIEYNLKVHYKYDQTKPPADFDLSFDGENIPMSKNSDYDAGRTGGTTDSDIAPSGGDWIDSVDWRYIDVKIFAENTDEIIPFTAFEKAPERIQNLFIREYCKEAIEDETGISVNEKRPDNIKSVPYC